MRTNLAEFDLLALREVAELLHCSKAHVCHVIAGRVKGCKPLPSLHLGRRTLVRRASLLQWIADNEHAAATSDNLESSPERGRKSA